MNQVFVYIMWAGVHHFLRGDMTVKAFNSGIDATLTQNTYLNTIFQGMCLVGN